MAVVLDTLEIAKRLKGAGFDESQAEAVTGVFRDLQASDRADLATKGDLERLEERLEAKFVGEFARLDAKIDTRIAELKADMIRWVFGIVFAQGALILGVLRFFPGGHP